MITKDDLDAFTKAYLMAFLFTEDEDAPGGVDYRATGRFDELFPRIPQTALAQAVEDCRAFQETEADRLAMAGDAEQNGFDFWFTRNGHGVGFWDRGYAKEVSDPLCASCKAFGEVWIDLLPACLVALAEELGEDPEDATEESWDHYGLTVFSFGGRDYAVGTDEEAESAALEYIRQSVWAFNAGFILGECDLPNALEDAIKAFQEAECEGANDALLALVEKTCGLASFARSAIAADGRGHFLASYDSDELELPRGFYAYRTN